MWKLIKEKRLSHKTEIAKMNLEYKIYIEMSCA